MNYSIVYSSLSGNTKMLAEAINEVLFENVCLYFGNSHDVLSDAPLIFVGFWTEKGVCDANTTAFLKTLKNKTIFLFGTAGFGGSQEYYAKILQDAQQHIDATNTVIGTTMCQGKMPISIRQRYEKMLNGTADDWNFKEQIENFDRAALHPNKDDLDSVKQLVLQSISKLKL